MLCSWADRKTNFKFSPLIIHLWSSSGNRTTYLKINSSKTASLANFISSGIPETKSNKSQDEVKRRWIKIRSGNQIRLIQLVVEFEMSSFFVPSDWRNLTIIRYNTYKIGFMIKFLNGILKGKMLWISNNNLCKSIRIFCKTSDFEKLYGIFS